MFCCYALPTGAIVFRHERRGVRRLGGAVRLATGDPNHMPRHVFAIAERQGPIWYVPGARGQRGPAFMKACKNFIQQMVNPEEIAA